MTGAVGGVRPKRIGAVERGKAGALGMKKISGSGAALTALTDNARKGKAEGRFGRTAAEAARPMVGGPLIAEAGAVRTCACGCDVQPPESRSEAGPLASC